MPNDFTVYDAYIGSLGVMYWEGEGSKQTRTYPLRPVRQDTGANPNEVRPESSDIFSQGDWTGGLGQDKFHEGREDPQVRSTRYWDADGIDISKEGVIKPVHAVAEAYNTATLEGRMAVAGGLVFVTDTDDVAVSNGALPGSWSSDYAAGGRVYDLAAEGSRVFAGVNSVTQPLRVRSAAGTWSVYQSGGVDITLGSGSCTRLLYHRGRLIAVGSPGGGSGPSRSIYEVTGSTATPSDMNPLPEGWSYQRPFTNGEYVYCCAVNSSMQRSEVWRFGLDSAGTAMEVKGYTPMPPGHLVYAGCASVGTVFLAGGRVTQSFPRPIAYIAQPNENGALDYRVLHEDQNQGQIVQAVTPVGNSIVFGWSINIPTGAKSEGLAIYHLDKQAFTKHIRKTTPNSTPTIIWDITTFKNKLLFTVQEDGLYYEDTDNYLTSSSLTTSLATWGNAGPKSWSRVEAAVKMPSSTSIDIDYTTSPLADGTWTDTGSDIAAGATSYSQTLSGVSGDAFALRFNLTASGANAPELRSFSVRSDPKRNTNEYKLVRTVRLMDEDRSNRKGEKRFQNTRTVLGQLLATLHTHTTIYEPHSTWTNAYVEDITFVEPTNPIHRLASGSPEREAHLVQLTIRAERT